jgi:hypothetical protein
MTMASIKCDMIKMIKFVRLTGVAVICCLYVTLASCTGEKVEQSINDVEAELLADGVIWRDDFVSVDNMLIADTTMWIYSRENNGKLLYAFSLSGDLLADGIGMGNGKDEVLELSSLHSDAAGNVMLYDSKLGKIYEVNCNDSMLTLATKCEQLRMFDDAILVRDEWSISMPTNSNISYVLRDNNFVGMDSLSYFPPKPSGVSDETHHLACTGVMAFAQNDQTFVRSVVYDGGLDFFKISDNKIVFVKRSAVFDMNYDVLRTVVNLPIPSEKSQTGYAHVYATSNYFYASFSSAIAEENPEAMAKEIHVFDHLGNPVRRLMFENEIGAFAVTADDALLYAAGNAEECSPIYIYKLK